MNNLICPHCKNKLEYNSKTLKCINNHSYDVSKHNYVNFLQHGKLHGDNKEMILARKSFLDLGYYEPLKNAISSEVASLGKISTFLDAGCGEGYYTEGIIPHVSLENSWGVDISKDALIFAHKRNKELNLAVGSVYDMSFFDDMTFDLVTSIFSPFAGKEINRVLKNDGILLSVIPGKYHLFGIKSIVYDSPYLNTLKPFEEEGFEFISQVPINYDITLDSKDALTLWKMTPYYYRSPKSGIDKLSSQNEISTPVSFHILKYKAKSEMKKYSGEMDVAMLCDGILYLYGYARYRKGEIDNNILDLYAENGKWQAEWCGVETLKVYKDDYTATADGRKYLMDMHIKYGVNPKRLIRIYFCWDESNKRIIIGHMPTHLATLKQNT